MASNYISYLYVGGVARVVHGCKSASVGRPTSLQQRTFIEFSLVRARRPNDSSGRSKLEQSVVVTQYDKTIEIS